MPVSATLNSTPPSTPREVTLTEPSLVYFKELVTKFCSLRVHEFGRKPRVEFLALLVGDAEFFELRVEDRFTHQLALCVRR
jgi:hypothetical protein